MNNSPVIQIPAAATFVIAQVLSTEAVRDYSDVVNSCTGEIIERRFSKVTSRSLTACDISSGNIINNLPGALDCECGDLIRVSVEVVRKARDANPL